MSDNTKLLQLVADYDVVATSYQEAKARYVATQDPYHKARKEATELEERLIAARIAISDHLSERGGIPDYR